MTPSQCKTRPQRATNVIETSMMTVMSRTQTGGDCRTNHGRASSGVEPAPELRDAVFDLAHPRFVKSVHHRNVLPATKKAKNAISMPGMTTLMPKSPAITACLEGGALSIQRSSRSQTSFCAARAASAASLSACFAACRLRSASCCFSRAARSCRCAQDACDVRFGDLRLPYHQSGQ